MPLPTADLPAPIAVLMLAWDEATPAVRALVEATRASTPTVDSVLVMVPQAEAPPALREAEHLPLAQEIETPTLPAEAPASLDPVSPSGEASQPALPAELVAEQTEPAPSEQLPTESLAPSLLPTPTLTWAAVRVLRLSSYSLLQLASRAGQPLPAPLWVGQAAIPSAPYRGATPLAAAPAASLSPALNPATAELPASVEELSVVPLLPTIALAPVAQPGSLPGTLAPTASLYVPAEELSQAALESDLPPSDTDELAPVDTTSPDLLPPNELPQEPAQAGWSAALDSLRQPSAMPAPPVPAPEPAAAEVPAALRPVAAHYPAPNLNFQVIQYARFAVPVALAEPSFAVIYAPAWPTWLAAQELRQRTGRPLVLHLASLAAPAGESAETAAGWMAELQRQALHRADVVLAETPALAERLYHELGLATDTVRVVPATDAAAIAQALHEARVRPATNPA